MTDAGEAVAELITIRDWLRYAVSRFNGADLVYGHGTSSALDEAAFLILETLRLPVDDINPWLDARLTTRERKALSRIVDARIATRVPAAYLVNAAYIRGHKFYVDERTIVPRSYIGELLDEGLEARLPDMRVPATILDLCTGGGSLAVLAALAYPEARIDAVDLSPDALEVARRNVDDYGLQDRVALIGSDLFSALAGRRYDLILSNPPYVRQDAVALFPPEYRTEPVMAHAGGIDGLDLVRRILAGAAAHLEPGGTLIVEVGQGGDTLEAQFPKLPFHWLDTAESEGEVFALPASALAARHPRKRQR